MLLLSYFAHGYINAPSRRCSRFLRTSRFHGTRWPPLATSSCVTHVRQRSRLGSDADKCPKRCAICTDQISRVRARSNICVKPRSHNGFPTRTTTGQKREERDVRHLN
jgi:hypothetical protein